MSQWDPINAFSIAHELCAGECTITDEPDEVTPGIARVTARCTGCGATVSTSIDMDEEGQHEEMAAITDALLAASGKSLQEIGSMTNEQREELLVKALNTSPRLAQLLERAYQKAHGSSKRH